MRKILILLILCSTASAVRTRSRHAELSGLLMDNHPQYMLAKGTRPFSGNVDLGGYKFINTGYDANSLLYIDLVGDIVAVDSNIPDWNAAYAHVSSNGTDHTYIDQDLQTTASPTFAGLTVDNININGNDIISTTGNIVIQADSNETRIDTGSNDVGWRFAGTTTVAGGTYPVLNPWCDFAGAGPYTGYGVISHILFIRDITGTYDPSILLYDHTEDKYGGLRYISTSDYMEFYTGASNQDIRIAPHGTGNVLIDGEVRIGDTTAPTEELEVNGQIALQGKSELTIDANSITPTKSFHTVDTEGDIASDELVTITFTGDTDGTILVIRPVNDARTIVVKNGTGNIVCGKTGGDVTLDDETDTFMAIYDTNLNVWLEL